MRQRVPAASAPPRSVPRKADGPLQRLADRSPAAARLAALQAMAAPLQAMSLEEEEPLQGKADPLQAQGLEEEEPLQGKADPLQAQGLEEEEPLQGKTAPVQREAGDRGGLPAQLRDGVEALSGTSMDGVQVHYNSAAPASVGALAFAQGDDIHLAPGEDRHLPHEAWHVAQQRQGLVAPTASVGGVAVNDSPSLESEADAMGRKALDTTPARDSEG